MTVSYAARLGIDPPALERHIDEGAKLFHLLVLALIEHSGPMTLEDLVRRLGAAGVGSRIGDLGHSIQKAWHGLRPVLRGKDGRFDLDLECEELRFLLQDLGLRKPAAPSPGHAEPPVPPERGDHEPLTEHEVKVVVGRPALSPQRTTAAILDMAGRPMSVAEVDAFSKACSKYARPIAGDVLSGWRTDLILRDDDGRLVLNQASEALVPMRRAVRTLGRSRLVQEVRQAHRAERREARKEELDATAREDKAQAAAARRAVLRLVEGPPGRAAALIDLRDRSIRTFMPDEVRELPAALGVFDVLIGLDLREHLGGLGLEPNRWRLIDLAPPRKSLRINKRGRTLKITTELLMASSVGISRGLGDPKKTAKYLAGGDHGKLARRLASDAKHLAAYHAFGAAHCCVRLRWGFLDQRLHVAWALPGDPLVHDVLKQAAASATPVEAVLGWSAPGWEQPWARATVAVGPLVV